MKQKIHLLSFLLCLLFALPGYTQTSVEQYVEGEIMVQLYHASAIDNLVSDYRAFGMKKKQTVSERFNIYLIRFDNTRASNQSMLEAIQGHRSVVHAQNNHYVSLRESSETTPNDSLYGSQWSMKNIGQNGGTPGADIDAEAAWDLATGGLTANGDTIVVAIIDGGSDINHEDLDHWINYSEIPGNGIDDDTNGFIDDRYGWNAFDHNGNIPFHQHGAHVAGTVGARGNNTKGVTGVNWQVKVLPVAGSSSLESTVVEALAYVFVVRERYDQTAGAEGAFVVADNCSFGVNMGQPEDYPIWEAMYDSLGSLGILSIGATANANWDIDEVGDIPTGFSTPYMIAVTNTTRDDEKNSSAAYGDTTIDLGAPGTGIISTLINNNYGNKTGTSMATPHVAGAVALLMSAADTLFMESYKNNPGEAVLQIKNHILNGTDTLPDLMGNTVTGGRLNLFKAVNQLLEAPMLAVDKDSVYSELEINSTAYENLFLINAGSDTIHYTITVDSDPEWLLLDHYDGSLPALEIDEINLTFNSAGLDTGLYFTTLNIAAQNIATRYIPVTMMVRTGVGINAGTLDVEDIVVFPNPFSSAVNISVPYAKGALYELEVYDLSGKMVFTHLFEPGRHTSSVSWKTSRSGVYFYRILKDGSPVGSGKLIRL